MHPYRMQQLIKERAKDTVVNVARSNSVYQTIDRLERSGLIAVREMHRDERRPERIVYQITDEGESTLRQWLRAMLSSLAREFPEFPAALATLAILGPDDVLRQLEEREAVLTERVRAIEQALATQTPVPGVPLPRVVVLEDEYRLAMDRAELAWLREITDDLRSGRLNWSQAQLREFAERAEAEADDAMTADQ